MKQDFASSNPETFLLEAPINRRRQETFHGTWVRYLAGLLILLASHISAYGQRGNISTGSTNVCYGSYHPDIKVGNISPCMGPVKYYWRRRRESNTTWEKAINKYTGTDEYVKPGGVFQDKERLYQSVEYRIEVWSVGWFNTHSWCGATNVITFKVDKFFAGKITGNTEICRGADAGKITGTPNDCNFLDNVSFHWQKWEDGDKQWTLIPNEKGKDYSPRKLEKTTWFRRGIGTSSKDTKYTDNIKITVYELPPGEIGSDKTICYNTNPGEIGDKTAAGRTPTFYGGCNYGSLRGSLNAGRYTLSDLEKKGLRNDDIRSLKVPPGFGVVLYQHDNFEGRSITKYSDDACLSDDGFNDEVSSIIVSTFYNWQKWEEGDKAWTDLRGMNVPSYWPGRLTKTTWFRRGVSRGGCGPVYKDNTGVKITVYPELKPGEIGKDQTICYNTTPREITNVASASGGGGGGYTYNWQKWEDGDKAWTDLRGINGASYSPDRLTKTTWFRRGVSRGGCGPVYKDNTGVKITVLPELKPGEIGSDTTICYGSTAGEITSVKAASGGAITYNWQKREEGATAWTDIPAAKAASYRPPDSLKITTYFRRGASSGNCGPVYKDNTGVKITVLPELKPGEIGGDTTICYGSKAGEITNVAPASGMPDSTLTYNWQKWEQGDSVWTDIPAAKDSSYQPPDSLTKTTYFRRGVSSGNCGPVYKDSTGVTITVVAELKPGEIGSDTTICYGSKAGEITNVTAASGMPDSTLTYNWQKWEQGDSVWTDIPAAKDSSYQPPDSLTKTTYFRRGVSSGNCGPVYKDDTGVKITVVAELKPGEIGSDTTICYGSKAGEITNVAPASGMPDSTLTYNWQKWEQGDSVWTDIPAAKDSSYSPPDSLTKTTYFRRGVSSGNCGPVYKDSTVVTITVLPELKPGEIGSDTTICYGSKAGEITNVTAASGMPDSTLTYNWQKWEQGDTIWTDIPDAKDTSYQPPDSLKITTYFRRGVSSGNCGPVYKDDTGVKITVVAELKPGEIGSDTTICYGSKAGEITNVTAASGMPDSALTYNWQKWEDGDTVWTDIPDAKEASYSPPDTLIKTTYFRRGVSSGNCGPVYKDHTGVTITVLPELKPGEIGSDTTICYGSKAGEITNVTAASGMPDSALTYNWQKWEQGDSVWTDIPDAKKASYSPPDSLKITTYFRRGVSSGNCGPVYKDDTGVKITVFPELKPGEIGEDKSIPEHSHAGTIKNLIAASGGPDSTNLIYNWQKKEEGDTAWTDIPDEKREKYMPKEELIKTTSYRRGVTSGNCGPVYKDDTGVKITVIPTRRKDPPEQ